MRFLKPPCLAELGRSDEAIAVYDQVERRNGERAELPLAELVAMALYSKSRRLLIMSAQTEEASQERRDLWQRAEDALVEYSRHTGKPLNEVYNYACLLALRGEEDGAIEALARCLAAGEVSVDHVREDSDWDALRSNPGFEPLLRDSGEAPALS